MIIISHFILGTVLSLGLSVLQFVDLNSTRNLVIIGFSFFMGMVTPSWIKDNLELIDTGTFLYISMW